MTFSTPGSYRDRWVSWVKDPVLEAYALTFDRTPAGIITAPQGRVRVCAWHMDFDERPACYLDVVSVDEARWLCENLGSACGWNVDFATAHDGAGATLIARLY